LHHLTLTENAITDNRVGVALERVGESIVQSNRLFGNPEAGVMLLGCKDVKVEGNELEKTE
jgi:parallel beta-helix repeat protein